jgi:hypothetical protein
MNDNKDNVTITKIKDNVWKAEGSAIYYISRFNCPHCSDSIFICTCPDFMMGRPKRDINPLEFPCKHILALWDSESEAGGQG